MPVELVVPSVGESITEVQIGAWLVSVGDPLQRDQPIVEIESEKATIEVSAPVAGKLTKILKQSGDPATVGDVLGYMEEGEVEIAESTSTESAVATADPPATTEGPRVMPAAKRAMAESGVALGDVQATGPGGRVLKEDVQRAAQAPPAPPKPASTAPAAPTGSRERETVPMSPMRKTIAARLVEAQQTAALLTTFNEVDMSTVKTLRAEHRDTFLERYGVKLGFMSFFVKAAVDALKQYPQVNAQIHDNDIVYHNYCDIGIAIGGGKGLVVPILRNAERMSFAEVEQTIGDLAVRAQANKISMDELKGGTFTISNGGIYGSMLSTPIVNPPQSAILGLHAINDRPMAVNGEVVIRPMMFIALTYDHRVIDGKGAVTFLKRIKECIENPSRMLLEI